jgi:hypothetical protein
MTLKIERAPAGQNAMTIRLVGRMQAEHIAEVRAQIQDSGAGVTLDMSELALVDLHAVRFLGDCQREGVTLLHCPPYISNWITREQEGEK